jgi:TRAP-type C4-dicarboxylate transport system permease small subunit
MRSSLRLLPPLLTLAASCAFALLGVAIWMQRYIPVGITDPTSFKVNAIISGAIFLPAVLGVLVSVVALIQRLLPQQKHP